jgi:hypothetical protein
MMLQVAKLVARIALLHFLNLLLSEHSGKALDAMKDADDVIADKITAQFAIVLLGQCGDTFGQCCLLIDG